ncbi:MAG: delta-60 repeat domain-containing protein [Leptospiraceae bacterium]|nr:delta-60 repeat domain-containing protein [Leptospiraceae bacterium]MDW7975094.1 delta-60 repeat domain-containing protein [Leptospiraceae bacterium]
MSLKKLVLVGGLILYVFSCIQFKELPSDPTTPTGLFRTLLRQNLLNEQNEQTEDNINPNPENENTNPNSNTDNFNNSSNNNNSNNNDNNNNTYTEPRGEIDTSFGTLGKVIIDFDNNNDKAYAIAIQPNGKILLAGTAIVFISSDFALVRLNPDGSLDTSFGPSLNGKVTTDVSGAGSTEEGRAMVLQPDGKILVAGLSDQDSAVVRYHPDGNIDTQFGTNGIARSNYSMYDEAFSMAIDSAGRIILGGKASYIGRGYDFALFRFLPNGNLDTSFNGNGYLIEDFGSSDYIRSVKIQQPGDKILVVGDSEVNSLPNYEFFVLRYNASGIPDTEFDSDGISYVDINFVDDAYDIAIQPNNQIIVVGNTTEGVGPGRDVGIIRLNSDGSLDTSFGNGGEVIIDMDETNSNIYGDYDKDFAMKVALQPNGKIIVVGYTEKIFNNRFNEKIFIIRLNPDGSLDNTFGNNGKLVIDLIPELQDYEEEVINSVAILPNGNILVAGYVLTSSSGYDFFVMRIK